ncbi:MAG: hypothetical protein H7070_10515 [Saprospiraceae bacterium]|nr:hypothetical protein [Pyrinomonadaceae bacterium]
MFRLAALVFFIGSIALAISGQKIQTQKTELAVQMPKNFEAEIALAKLALEAHGGAKLKAMKTLVISGSVNVTMSASAQTIPATFITIFSNEKYRIEIKNPFQPLKQVYDGTQTLSSMQGGFTLPPINRLGFPLLPRIGEPSFIITSLPLETKKKRGFRMTSPEGYFTDFYLDEKTNQIKGYDSSYEMNGRNITTSVEIDKMRVVDGVTVPEKYVQRFDMEKLSVYAEFKAKEILVNSAVADDVFSLGN